VLPSAQDIAYLYASALVSRANGIGLFHALTELINGRPWLPETA
jgi:hypothetical protein